jgi:hypothetical protein
MQNLVVVVVVVVVVVTARRIWCRSQRWRSETKVFP